MAIYKKIKKTIRDFKKPIMNGVAICPASRTNSVRAICPAIVMRMSYNVRSEVRVTLSSVAPRGRV